MSKNRIDPEAGFVNRAKMRKGPNGFNLCRQCAKECASNHRTFCGPKCVGKWKIKTDPGYVRHQVFLRDKGVCVRCQLDTTRIKDMLELLWEMAPAPYVWEMIGRPGFPEFLRYKREIENLLKVGHRSSYWDADHIKPVKDGGGGCNLRNYQTLCIWCHKTKTKEQAAKVE